MPSKEHEALVELFRHSPSFVAELLVDALGLAVPDHQQARVEPAELTDFAPTR